jgi:hypothetical protein
MIDDSRFPLVFLVCPYELTSEFMNDFERGYERLFARRSKFVVICDLCAIGKVPDALMRKRLADVLNRPDFKERQATYQVGSANLIASAAIRAALTGLLWLWHPSSPMATPSTRAEAIKWALERLREAHVEVPPSLEFFAMTEGVEPSSRRSAR